ncbi:hypothetical protein F4775DRAFT_192726 [Biscogniauxia sp. FL1348]|nr:hypothetical protein F4775DRAFT_192726 [Biscogniauxia sp. FL1348]
MLGVLMLFWLIVFFPFSFSLFFLFLFLRPRLRSTTHRLGNASQEEEKEEEKRALSRGASPIVSLSFDCRISSSSDQSCSKPIPS